MKKLKLFPKTFLYTFSLMIIIVAISHLLVYILLPAVYHYRQRNALETDIEKLCREIADTEDAGRLALVTDFAGKWYADILIKYDGYTYEMKLLNVWDDGYLKCSKDTENPSGDKEDVSIIAEESDGKIKISLSRNPKGDKNFFYAEQIFPNQKGYVRAVISRQQIEDAVSTIIVILPVTAFACTLISLLSALLYSHMLTKPIKQITNVTKQMQGLTHGISCEVHTHDEIETLADNVNALYDNLLKTIHNLEQEIYKVEEMEVQKTNLMRSASHELKTPVTAINAMLENMILNVGKYEDHTIYLPKCKMLTEQLAVMIKEILDASKSATNDKEKDTEIDISELIAKMSEPYQMIAKSKGIRIEMDVSEKFSVHYPISMIRKVISNLLSNAVSYTPKGGTIKIYIEEQKLVLENECVPIPQEYQKHIFEPFYRFEYGGKDTKGNGLGLYIVDAVLRTLQILYMFTALEDNSGMRFTIDFE
ncbi:sensor histidine kinase QseE [Lachnospiraceae bacterium]|nr:sensor histidine kinase QseE [Lachnospiraceae bacterium]